MRSRLLFITLVCLVAAPVLAGCARNDTTTTPTATGTPTSSNITPTTTATPTTTPTAIPTAIPTIPVGTNLNLELKIGLMMPMTGALADLGPDMRDGALLAIDEINTAGAAFGLRVTHTLVDDGTTDSAGAPNKFNSLAGEGVTAIAGPCCSGVTNSVLDLAVQNQIVVASPSATSPILTMKEDGSPRDNQGYFWRVAPSDAVQGKVLANLVKEQGDTSANLIIVNNAYGTGLAKVFEEHFEANGGTVGKVEKYNEGASEFSAPVTSVCGGTTPDALVLVAYIADGANIIKELSKQGCLSKYKDHIYGSEGVYKGNGPEGLPARAGQDSSGAWLAAGVRGTTPAAGDNSSYVAKFKAKYPGNEPGLYSAESYDAVMYIALAAIAARSVDGEDIAGNLLKIAMGGQKVNGFQQAAALLIAGQDIDWQGQAHDFDYEDDHEPGTGIYDWWMVGADGQVTTTASGKSA